MERKKELIEQRASLMATRELMDRGSDEFIDINRSIRAIEVYLKELTRASQPDDVRTSTLGEDYGEAIDTLLRKHTGEEK